MRSLEPGLLIRSHAPSYCSNIDGRAVLGFMCSASIQCDSLMFGGGNTHSEIYRTCLSSVPNTLESPINVLSRFLCSWRENGTIRLSMNVAASVSGAISVSQMNASIGEGSASFARNSAGGNGGKDNRSTRADARHPPVSSLLPLLSYLLKLFYELESRAARSQALLQYCVLYPTRPRPQAPDSTLTHNQLNCRPRSWLRGTSVRAMVALE